MTDLNRLTIRRPDDWHLHLRDGDVLNAVTPHSTAHFARAIIMPNLVPPVVTAKEAVAYRDRIRAAIPDGDVFEPLMTLYLTEATDPDDLEQGARDGLIKAVKLYPAGATTNSQSGVKTIESVYPVFERMAEIGLPLLFHGEVTDPEIDIFDREAVFIDRVLDPLRARFPALRIVMEHLTTRDGVDYVVSSDKNLAATITPHHLIINRNALFAGGIRPDYFCLPIAKREKHRLALRGAATSGDKRFFLGTDSAPHEASTKYAACGCAGVFNAPNTLSCVAHVFDEEDALDHLEGFTSLNGPAYYRMAPNEQQITLVKRDTPVEHLNAEAYDGGSITIFDPGFELFWHIENEARS